MFCEPDPGHLADEAIMFTSLFRLVPVAVVSTALFVLAGCAASGTTASKASQKKQMENPQMNQDLAAFHASTYAGNEPAW